MKGNFYAVKIVDSCIKLFAEFNAWPQHLELEALPAEEANFLPFYAVGAENPPGIGAAVRFTHPRITPDRGSDTVLRFPAFPDHYARW